MPEIVHVNLRLPAELAQQLREIAELDARSLNAEIIVALREWLESRRQSVRRNR